MNVYEVVTARILESLEAGVVPWRKPWRTETPKNLISGRDYRGVNVLLLQSTRFASSYWLTFNQARARGGSVKKGERGCPVIFWKVTDEKTARRKRGKPLTPTALVAAIESLVGRRTRAR